MKPSRVIYQTEIWFNMITHTYSQQYETKHIDAYLYLLLVHCHPVRVYISLLFCCTIIRWWPYGRCISWQNQTNLFFNLLKLDLFCRITTVHALFDLNVLFVCLVYHYIAGLLLYHLLCKFLIFESLCL